MNEHAHAEIVQLDQFGSRKKAQHIKEQILALDDDLLAWIEVYLETAVQGVRSHDIAEKIETHLERFVVFFFKRYGHERISTVLKRDVLAWMMALQAEETEEGEPAALAPATVNNHLTSFSGFTTWSHAQRDDLFALGNPCSGVKELPLPALVPRTLSQGVTVNTKWRN